MDQLGVVTAVLVLSTLLTCVGDLRRFLRRKLGKEGSPDCALPSVAGGAGDPAAATPDLVTTLMSDFESDDERKVARALALVDKLPSAKVSLALTQLLRHPRDEVSVRAATALMQLGRPESIEPLYLYFNARVSRAPAA
jgi:hypothetical protein